MASTNVDSSVHVSRVPAFDLTCNVPAVGACARAFRRGGRGGGRSEAHPRLERDRDSRYADGSTTTPSGTVGDISAFALRDGVLWFVSADVLDRAVRSDDCD